MSFYKTPGSLTLKSTFPMDYSRTTLSNKWHLKREGEPVDNALWSGDKPNLHQSTYKYLAQKMHDEELNKISETHAAHTDMFAKKANHIVKPAQNSMVDYSNADSVIKSLQRKNEAYDTQKALAKHKTGHDTHYLETTYNNDYQSPNPSIKLQPVQEKPTFDNSWKHRRMISQFSDIDAPKREGINTFHVQTGVYPNQHLKTQLN